VGAADKRMAQVSNETLDDVRRELYRFKNERGHANGLVAAAHLAGAVEMLLEEADSGNNVVTDHSGRQRLS
jgi:hypothetical protein